MTLSWVTCIAFYVAVFSILVTSKKHNLSPTKSSISQRSIDVTATAKVDVDDGQQKRIFKQHHFKPTKSSHFLKIKNRRKNRRKERKGKNKNSKRSFGIKRITSDIFNRRSLPLENPHPKEEIINPSEELNFSNEVTDDDETDDTKPTDNPNDYEVPPTEATDTSEAGDGSTKSGIIDSNYENDELDADDDEEDSDNLSPTDDPPPSEKIIAPSNEKLNKNTKSEITNNLNSKNIAPTVSTPTIPIKKSNENTKQNKSESENVKDIVTVERVDDNLTNVSDSDKDFIKLQKLEQDINRIAGDLAIKRNEILKRLREKSKYPVEPVLT